jgi:hypothetical protein
MRQVNATAARRPLPLPILLPLAALLLAMSLGGCIAYNGYPDGYPGGYPGYYGYTYRNDYADYTYRRRPYYSPDYNSAFDTYQTSGGGSR